MKFYWPGIFNAIRWYLLQYKFQYLVTIMWIVSTFITATVNPDNGMLLLAGCTILTVCLLIASVIHVDEDHTDHEISKCGYGKYYWHRQFVAWALITVVFVIIPGVMIVLGFA